MLSVANSITTLTAFPKSGPKPALAAAERLFACYPQQAPNRPKEYMAAVVSLLAEYPNEIVDAVCEPKRGIATRCKFLPTIAGLSEALELEMEPHRKAWREQHEKRTALPRYEPPKRSQEEIDRVIKLAADTKNKLFSEEPTHDH